jgi:hypothetical protein
MNFGMSNLLARRGAFTRVRGPKEARDEASGAIEGKGGEDWTPTDAGQSPTRIDEHYAGRHPCITCHTTSVGRLCSGVRGNAQIIFGRDLLLERVRK